MAHINSVSPTQRRITWAVRILLAITFAAAGIAKLASLPQMIAVFDAIGVGQWFRYLTGALEIAGVALLLAPATGYFGALLLALTMVGAVATHLLLIGGSAAPAVVLGVLSAFVAFRLRPGSRLASPAPETV